jgi:hypothetical protein
MLTFLIRWGQKMTIRKLNLNICYLINNLNNREGGEQFKLINIRYIKSISCNNNNKKKWFATVQFAFKKAKKTLCLFICKTLN